MLPLTQAWNDSKHATKKDLKHKGVNFNAFSTNRIGGFYRCDPIACLEPIHHIFVASDLSLLTGASIRLSRGKHITITAPRAVVSMGSLLIPDAEFCY